MCSLFPPGPFASRTCRRVSFSSSFSVTLFSRCSIDTLSCAHASISLIVSTNVVCSAACGSAADNQQQP